VAKVARIDVRWITWYPTRGWYVGFWAEVAREVRRQKVKRGDRASVVRVCREVSSKMPKTIKIKSGVTV